MSGHNKWSKVKHKKAVTDARKSKAFSKHAQLITKAVRDAGGDTGAAAVKTAVEQAKKENMPADNIKRALDRGSGANAGTLEEITYEAYGPGGVGILVQALTDNRNRTAAEVKQTLAKHAITLAEPGATSWAFIRTGGAYEPSTTVPLSFEQHEVLTTITTALEELDDVEAVYTNAAS